MDQVRALERTMRLPANCIFPLALGVLLLGIFLFQSTSMTCPGVEVQAKKVSALTSAVEEMTVVQAQDRKELAQSLQHLEEVKRDRNKLQEWRTEQEKKTLATFGTFVTIIRDMNKMLEDTQAALTKAGLGQPPPPPPPPPPSREALMEKFRVTKKEVDAATKELVSLTKAGRPTTGDWNLRLLSPRLLAVRIRLEELKGTLTVAADAASLGVQEKDEVACNKEDIDKCNALGSVVEEMKKGGKSESYAIAQCAETVVDLSLRLQQEKSATRSKATSLLRILERASASPSFDEPLKKELARAVDTCHKSFEGAKDETEKPIPLSALAPSSADIGMCKAMGCKCTASAEDLDQYLNYTAHAVCPDDWLLVQKLIVEHNCHSLPRRRCFAPNWEDYQEPLPLPTSLWDPKALKDSNVRWENHFCQNFTCLMTSEGAPVDCPGCFDWKEEKKKYEDKGKSQMSMSEALKLTAKNTTLRIGLDLGGGTGSFAAMMAEHKVTIITTGVDLDSRPDIGGGGEDVAPRNGTKLGAPFMETVALRGLIPLHLPHQARLPFFDSTLDIIHAQASVDGMDYSDFEDAFFDWDRVLRPGGLIWFSLFHSQVRKMPQYMEIVEMFKYKFIHRTVTPSVRSDGLHVYINFLIEKPRERDIAEPGPPPFE